MWWAILQTVLLIALLVWLETKLEHWNWSRCKCGKEKLPWFGRYHYKEGFMWIWVVWGAGFAVYDALVERELMWGIFMGVYGVYSYRRIHEHRKGKKSVLGRLLGRVTFNEHGRLIVVQTR
jgi:hypothetical protein